MSIKTVICIWMFLFFVHRYWPCSVGKHSICCRNVCPSVCHTCESRLNGSRYWHMLYTFLEVRVRNDEFRGSPWTGASKKGTPCQQQKFGQYSATGCRLVLLTNRRSHSDAYGLLIKSETGDLEWPWTAWWPLFCIVSPKAVAFGTNYDRMIEARCVMSATEM